MSAGSHRPFVSLRFTPAGRTFSFLLPDLALDDPTAGDRAAAASPQPGEQLVVETPEGPAIGTVTRTNSAHAERRQPAPDSPQVVVRRATREDVVQRLKQQQLEQQAHRVAQLKIRERGLPMKLTKVEQLFDGSRIVFYYTVRRAGRFPRAGARSGGALPHPNRDASDWRARRGARCSAATARAGGRSAARRGSDFEPISIKMAKQQDLSLNPSKLSGQCGRLKCCLRYELPNGKGVKHGGCADKAAANPTARVRPCGSGGCGTCGPGSCGIASWRVFPVSAITVGDPAGIGPEIAREGGRRSRGCRAVCEPIAVRPAHRADRGFPPGVLSAAAGRAAYDAIVARGRRRAGAAHRCDRDGADQQGGVRARGLAVERAHRPAGAPDGPPRVAMMFYAERAARRPRDHSRAARRRAAGC